MSVGEGDLDLKSRSLSRPCWGDRYWRRISVPLLAPRRSASSFRGVRSANRRGWEGRHPFLLSLLSPNLEERKRTPGVALAEMSPAWRMMMRWSEARTFFGSMSRGHSPFSHHLHSFFRRLQQRRPTTRRSSLQPPSSTSVLCYSYYYCARVIALSYCYSSSSP